MKENSMETAQRPFLTSLPGAEIREFPYRHWLLDHCLPEDVIDAIINLPIAPVHIGNTKGKRDTHNKTRVLFSEANRKQYKVMDELARAFQFQETVDALKEATGALLSDTSLRIEYCQDTDGFWLEPHTDIGVKRFTLLIYLNREPEGADWGTDIYADPHTHVGRAPAGFNSGFIFVPSDKTWHGFEKRPINGVRKSLIINYVTQDWRSREELSFPDVVVR
ncbi:2OG-Fe(II) oxygenase [Thiobacillus sp. SCN 63-57]|uniref:2OG-Fe(II) oxygenase family protein n=2 Tax=unclassified Thiobacillus TaxID=2646513 RepID=UPI000A728E8E|nr:2OG-Fe(II) oxygenase [Thiobacillus sp. SCN 63-57]